MECLAKMERLLSELTFEMTKLPQTVLGSHQVFVDSVTTLNDLMILFRFIWLYSKHSLLKNVETYKRRHLNLSLHPFRESKREIFMPHEMIDPQ